jgi:hypothetical protein
MLCYEGIGYWGVTGATHAASCCAASAADGNGNGVSCCLFSLQVRVQAGARVQAVADELRQAGLSLQNYASIREQTVGGFIQVGWLGGQTGHGALCGWEGWLGWAEWAAPCSQCWAAIPSRWQHAAFASVEASSTRSRPCGPCPDRSARTAPVPPSLQWMSRWWP